MLSIMRLLLRLLPLLVLAWPCRADDAGGTGAAATQVPLVFTGGHETDPRDHGRPVVLVAGALKVTPEVFREAFSHVHPAGPGSGGPTDAEARANKKALMDALAPYGVTDERLNQVSNRYRYRSWMGELWPTHAAAGYATVSNGAVTGFVVTDPGFGYSSPPTVSVKDMPSVQPAATLAFDADFSKNGSIQSVALAAPAK
jgi:hypothetical protein